MNKPTFIDTFQMLIAVYLIYEAVYNLELPREALIIFSVASGFIYGVQMMIHLEWIIYVVKRTFKKD